MKLLHLGDLHFGKRIDNLSLIEDQLYINEKILKVIDEKKIDAVLIAGDVYDKSIPSEEAVSVFDGFLVELAKRSLPVMIISGNHDSAERLSFGERLVEASKIYISPTYDGKVKKVELRDAYGPICFYLLPFVKPIHVQHYYQDEKIETYSEAVKMAVAHMDLDLSIRNVILSHQFVTGASRDGSEDEFAVGGITNVDVSAYDNFDYVALGHIHSPQYIQKENVRYSGSPIKFSFNEEKQVKGLTIVELKEKGNITIETIELEPLRDFVTLKGSYDDLKIGSSLVRNQDFIHVILTDEEDIPNAFSNLSLVYPQILSMSYDNHRTRNTSEVDGGVLDEKLHPEQLIEDFYKLRNDQDMTDDQKEYIGMLIQEIWGAEL